MRGSEQLRALRLLLFKVKYFYYVKLWRMDIDPSAHFSLSAKLDITHPAGIHIGPETYLCFGAVMLSHDMSRNMFAHTRIGARCFIGANATLMPGITIGDECIVAAGSVVTRDVPARSVVAGNPARVIRQNIKVGPYGVYKKDPDARGIGIFPAKPLSRRHDDPKTWEAA